jgi:serine/threonine-protein kinase
MGEDWVGQTFNGRYEILELLGTGGMSSVYKATDPNLDRVVAIKIIHQHLSRDPDFIRRFRDEATAVAQLRHPNIVQVFDFDTTDDTAYIVFEYVPGENLQDRLARLSESGSSMPFDQTSRISHQMIEALAYAHARGLVHRDVKPANIILDVQGDAFLADFGIVKITDGIQHTATGAVLGTARYMSPEQIKGTQIDGRSDLYSLGVTMFEMASGEPPFRADSAMTVMMMQVNDPVPNMDAAGIPAPFAGVIEGALAKEPDDRFSSADEMGAALHEAALTGGDTSAAVAAGLAGGQTAEKVAVSAEPDDGGDGTPVASDPSIGLAETTTSSTATTKRRRILMLVAAAVLGVAMIVLSIAWLSNGSDTSAADALVGAGDDQVGAIEAASATTTTVAPTTTAVTALTVAPLAVAPTTSSTTTTTVVLPPETVEIISIKTESGRYIVAYRTRGYFEALPGEHVHFYWNTLDEDQAGVGPTQADWFVWGGPRPFDGYRLTSRPLAADAMCSVVANPDHTIKLGTGNCVDLP